MNSFTTHDDPETGELFFRYCEAGLIFTWRGGPYVDIASGDVPESPFDCVNVWDYSHSRPVITEEDLPELAREWIKDNLSSWQETGALVSHITYYSQH